MQISQFVLDGTTYDPETDLQILHWHFGESWKVSRGDWLFSVPEIRVLIEREIERSSNFEPSYEIEFADENLEQQAAQVILSFASIKKSRHIF